MTEACRPSLDGAAGNIHSLTGFTHSAEAPDDGEQEQILEKPGNHTPAAR